MSNSESPDKSEDSVDSCPSTCRFQALLSSARQDNAKTPPSRNGTAADVQVGVGMHSGSSAGVSVAPVE